MAYTPPVSKESVKKSVKKYKHFFFSYILIFVTIFGSILLFNTFWTGKILWGLGSLVTMFSVISVRYFDIKKNSNPLSQFFNPQWENEKDKAEFTKWNSIENIVNYTWIVGSILMILSKWIEF